MKYDVIILSFEVWSILKVKYSSNIFKKKKETFKYNSISIILIYTEF